MKVNVAKIEEMISKYNGEKSSLISILHDIQSEYNYLPKQAIIRVSKKLDIPLIRVYGVATFYSRFSLVPKGRNQIQVCLGTACHVRGGKSVAEAVTRELGIKPGETSKDGEVSFDTVNCLGTCALGPIMVVNGKYYGQMTGRKVAKVLEEILHNVKESLKNEAN